MFDSLSPFFLGLIFVVAAVVVWFAGIHLSNSTDVLSKRWGLGEALGGLILLALVTNLPEIAITVSAAMHGEVAIAVSNILGGIAIQTLVLAILDAFGVGKSAALTYRAASLGLVLEGIAVIAILGVALMGTQLPPTLIFARVTPTSAIIAALWVTSLVLVNKSRKGLPWQENGKAPDSQEKERGDSQQHTEAEAKKKGIGTVQAFAIFVVGGIATLLCGVLLESSGEALAKHFGMTGALFGATVLAAATSLPEVSTGLAAVKLGDYQLAISDIFGGNAFLPVLFLVATLVSGKAVLPHAQSADIYLTGLGILLTGTYLVGLIFRPIKQIARLGLDSFFVVIFYVVGIIGLVAISHK